MTQLEKQIQHVEAELSAKSEELQNCKQILGTITQLTNSQYIR